MLESFGRLARVCCGNDRAADDEIARARGLRQIGEAQHLIENRALHSSLAKHLFVHAREHGNRDDQRRFAAFPLRGLVRGIPSGLHHARAAGGVNVDHPHAERCRRRHRRGDGVRDVVKFQVEEDSCPAARQRADDVRTLGGEEPAADLQPADNAAQRVCHRDRRLPVLDVERD